MRTGPLEALDAVVARGAAPEHAAAVAVLRREFEARTGAFGPEDAFFEVRSRAFWDDTVTRAGFAARLAPGELPEWVRPWCAAFARAHRGLFRAERGPDGATRVLADVWSGATFVLHAVDDGVRAEMDALDVEGTRTLFDGRVVALADPLAVALLPGVVFHAPDAAGPVARVLAAARARGLSTHTTLDALLKMEHSMRALSRVKPAYAYRVESL